MNNSIRNFFARAVQHVYQRSKDKGVIFYDDDDRIVFFCIASVLARKYKIVVLGFSIMFTHFHKALIAKLKTLLSKFIQDLTSIYARSYNHQHNRHGELFHPRFGSSSKKDPKIIRTTLAYVYNNHVEKGLCKHPIEERWCFLAYALSPNPFSPPINYESISKRFKSALRMVDKRRENEEYIKFRDLRNIRRGLSDVENNQLTDYIISKYMFIDFQAAAAFYNSFEAMLNSFDANSGSEWDLNEEYASFSDNEYVKMGDIFKRNKWEYKTVYSLPKCDKERIAKELYYKYGINNMAIKKYLHL